MANPLSVIKWYDVIEYGVFVNALLDRIVQSSHRFDLKEESLRKKLQLYNRNPFLLENKRDGYD